MIKIERPECPNPTALERNDYKHPDNKRALREASHDKCMYCESNSHANSYCDIEHIKPKSTFPEFEFEWENLGYACERCNREHKKDRYSDDLINPYDENPEYHLIMSGTFYFPRDNSQKAEVTDDIVRLNRPDLVASRSDHLAAFSKAVYRYNSIENEAQKEAVKEQLYEECLPDKEFSLMKKHVLMQLGFEF